MSAEELAALSTTELVHLVLALQTRLAALEAYVQTLRAENAALRARLEQPPKTPENSSVPPAKGWKRQRRTAPPADQPPAKRGPKPGHRGISRSRVASSAVDVVLPCRPEQCGHCGAALPAQGGTIAGRKQVVELPPVRPVVYEAQRWRVRCRRCQHTTVGRYPSGYGELGRFGPRLVATVAYLHEEQHVAYARLVPLLADLCGLQVSEGTLVAAVGRLGQALVPVAEAIGATVRQAAFIGSDETSVRVDGRTYWEWVFQTEAAAYTRSSSAATRRWC
jgi:transposase